MSGGPLPYSRGSVAKALFHRAGGLEAVRWMNRKGVRILMYHRFEDAAALDRQCAHIRKHYKPISMSAVADWLESGREAEPYSIAVTVDDGYRDFLEVGYPVFTKYGIPVTIFVVSDFLDGKRWLWFDQVVWAYQQARGPSAAAEARDIVERAKKMNDTERVRLVRELPAQIPEQAPPEYRPLNWDEVRWLAPRGVEFGAHTKTHPILSHVRGDEQLRDEMAGSKARIESELGLPVAHFCYPNGRMVDIGAAAVEAARAAGFRTAVTAEPGVNQVGADPFLLRRIGADPGHEELYFHRAVAAFRIGASRGSA